MLDSAARPGAKILVSGGSRCNVTNVEVSERDFNGGPPAIIRRVLKAFPPADVIAWFGSLGVPLHEEAHGKMFPDSHRSRDVLNALLEECRASGVDLQTAVRVEHITCGPPFTLDTSRHQIRAQTVVMATGGLSLPKTGSDGHGLSIVEALGHTIVPTTPALVPLITDDDRSVLQSLTGVSHEAELALWNDGSLARRLRGSLLWTHFGLSGPVVLDMSRHWLRAQLENRRVRVTVNLSGGEPFEALDADLTTRASARARASVQSLVAEMMPAALAAVVLARLGIDGNSRMANLPRADRRRLVHAAAECPASITGSRGYNYAEATAGGVPLDEIDSTTMQSRCCPGLYLVGEMLDVDGRIGGFNFQWAWSTARVAARALASRRFGLDNP